MRLAKMNKLIKNLDSDKFLEQVSKLMEGGMDEKEIARSLGFSDEEYRFLKNVARKVVNIKKESKA